MSETKSVKIANTGVVGLLGVLFVGLKLTGHIDWSWWLVLLPFYAGLAVALGFVVLVGIPMGVVVVASVISEGRRKRARLARNDARRFR